MLLLTDISYVLITECAWSVGPEQYGTMSTIHRYRLVLSKRGAYQAILNFCKPAPIFRSSIASTTSPILRRFPRKGGVVGYDGHKKGTGTKLSALFDQQSLLACKVAPANIHDSYLN